VPLFHGGVDGIVFAARDFAGSTGGRAALQRRVTYGERIRLAAELCAVDSRRRGCRPHINKNWADECVRPYMNFV
jgi:hypothetical protein